ncbi:MAG: hypothetical protein WBR15_04280 [Gammaproteobacteria bacterium]
MTKSNLAHLPATERSPARQMLADYLAKVRSLQLKITECALPLAKLNEAVAVEAQRRADLERVLQQDADALGEWARAGGTGPEPQPRATERKAAASSLADAIAHSAAAKRAAGEIVETSRKHNAELATLMPKLNPLRIAVLEEVAGEQGAEYRALALQVLEVSPSLDALTRLLATGASELHLDPAPASALAVKVGTFKSGEPPARDLLFQEARSRWITLWERLASDAAAEF